MSATLLAYALFVIWGTVALVALFMTDRCARRDARTLRSEYEGLTVIARADGTSIPEPTYRRASG